jgi:DNA repair protein RecN (Recombination protein N)
VDLLGEAVAACEGVAGIDPALRSDADALQEAAAQADEAARSLRRYLDQIEDDPEQLEATEERLLLIADLKRKFGDTIVDVLAYADRARERLRAVEQQDELLGELAERRARLRAEAGALAGEVSRRRAECADRLRQAVEAELADLNMAGTLFVVQLQQVDDPAGLPVGAGASERSLAFDATGVDRVEFLIAPNPGEDPRGLGRIASGGELSRISLALKTVLSRVDRRPTLIFDEVDVGVGGRSAPVVGEKLWGLTGDHQVLCVTHMPQVAAYADAHLVVSKGADERSSRVVVRRLEDAERVEELAAMLGGQVARAGARHTATELIAHAGSRKRGGVSA